MRQISKSSQQVIELTCPTPILLLFGHSWMCISCHWLVCLDGFRSTFETQGHINFLYICTLYNAQCTMYNVQCTMYNVDTQIGNDTVSTLLNDRVIFRPRFLNFQPFPCSHMGQVKETVFPAGKYWYITHFRKSDMYLWTEVSLNFLLKNVTILLDKYMLLYVFVQYLFL